MCRVPKDLDLSPVVGEFTTQVRVGQFDLQFTFGQSLTARPVPGMAGIIAPTASP
jgi:hypothetical protein